MTATIRILIALAGLAGAAGVALAAAAAHRVGDPGLGNAALILILHAAAALALAAHRGAGTGGLAGRLGAIAGFGLIVGAALFAGDLAARAFLGHRLFPNAAPTGGSVMILAWLAVAVAALIPGRR